MRDPRFGDPLESAVERDAELVAALHWLQAHAWACWFWWQMPNKRIEFAPFGPDSQTAMPFACGSFAALCLCVALAF